jgi:hypothetical protein
MSWVDRLIRTKIEHQEADCNRKLHPRPGFRRDELVSAWTSATAIAAMSNRARPVDRATISSESLCRSIIYWHVERAAHDVPLAEGLPTEA